MSKYKDITIERLYKGLIDIRHTVLNKCYKESIPIKITVKDRNGYMIILPNEFKSKSISVSKKLFKSQFKNEEPYKLVSFKWEPQKI